jgi:hypothetical protein
MTSLCWRNPNVECEHAKCCYDASCQAVFEYSKFANSKQWKKILKEAIEKEAQPEEEKVT